MPPPLTSSETGTRARILRTFPPAYEQKWWEMRRLQNSRYEAIHGNSITGAGSLFFGILGGLFLVGMISNKDTSGIVIAGCMITVGILCGIFFLVGLMEGKEELPELRQKIKILKRSPEIRAILKAFKEGDVEWMPQDDAAKSTYA